MALCGRKTTASCGLSLSLLMLLTMLAAKASAMAPLRILSESERDALLSGEWEENYDEEYDEEYYEEEENVVASGRDPTMFYRLSCNRPMSPCDTLFSKLPTPEEGSPVTIPCGVCVRMDYSDRTVTLADGLNIEGQLWIPGSARNLIISTPFVFVQGVLLIDTNARTLSPSNLIVKFFLTGTADRYLVPHAENAIACSESTKGCLVGKKAFVVAGGKVDIQAIHNEDCPTWVHLEDLVRNEPIQPSQASLPFSIDPPQGCDSRFLVEPKSWTKSMQGWTGNTYSKYEVMDNGNFRVYNRRYVWQGPTVDLVKRGVTSQCFSTSQYTLLYARLRLTRSDGNLSKCEDRGGSCPIVRSRVIVNGQTTTRSLSRLMVHRRGSWITLTAQFRWTEKEVDPNKTLHWIWIYNPEVGTDIEVSDFYLRLPPEDIYYGGRESAQYCKELVPGQGPDGIIPPFPIERKAFTNKFAVEEEEETVDGKTVTNKFYRLTGRHQGWHSITFPIIADCVKVKGSKYTVSMRLRIQSTNVVRPVATFKVKRSNGSSITNRPPPCPATGGNLGWVTCKVTWVVPDGFESAVEANFWVDTGAAKTAVVDYDDLSIRVDDGAINRLVLPAAVADKCWGVGAQVVLSSPTPYKTDYQKGVIKSVTEKDGKAIVELEDSIFNTVTMADDPRFAVEVAILARNIVMEGEGGDGKHGGHFMVLNTRRGDQTLEGIEFRNFGQQKNLGRYPIHFHLCGNVRGSKVSKNLVRRSNQRCFVVHGSHNLTVSDNVSFDTKGHCFMLEDGAELDNKILRNLLINVQSAEKIKADETDDRPSAFWISNARNEFVGNVAAGAGTGFWFEMRSAVRGPSADLPGNDYVPFRQPFHKFDDNTAHSCDVGIRTYPHGLLSPTGAVFRNIKIYKNTGDGIFVHVAKDLLIDGGVFADNEAAAIFQSKSNNITLKNVDIIGMTDLYKQYMVDHQRRHRCDDSGSWIFGIQWNHFFSGPRGLSSLEDVRFSGFDNNRCDASAAIGFDTQEKLAHHNMMIAMKDVVSEDGFPFVDACFAESMGVEDIAFHDLTSTLNPDKDSEFSGVSVIVSNKPAMKEFLKKCDAVPGTCVAYCEDACVRKVTFYTDRWGSEGYRLNVTDTGSGKSVEVSGRFRVLKRFDGRTGKKIPNEYDTSDWENLRAFSVSLPAGDYTAKFTDKDGNDIRPKFVQVDYERAPPCPDHVKEGGVEVKLPPVSQNECSQLINNGDGEALDYSQWYHDGGGIRWFAHGGVDNSAAIRSVQRLGYGQNFGQYLDTSCLKLNKGELYEITAKYKLEQRSGRPYVCRMRSPHFSSKCPEVSLELVKRNAKEGYSYTSSLYARASAVGPIRAGEFNKLQGVFTVTDEIAKAQAVFLNFGRFNPQGNLIVDEVSVRRYNRPEGCNEVILNGNFDSATDEFWGVRATGDFDLVNGFGGSGKALVMTGRQSMFSAPMQQLDKQCLVQGREYVVSAKFKLTKNGQPHICDRSAKEGDRRCPIARFKIAMSGGKNDFPIAATTTDAGSASSWGTIGGTFQVSGMMMRSPQVYFFIDNAPGKVDMAVDNVSMQPTAPLCPQNLVVNGNGWSSSGASTVSVANEGNEIVVTNRNSDTDGAVQELKIDCIQPQTFRLTANVRVEQDGKTYKCKVLTPKQRQKLKKKKKTTNACPVVNLVTANDKGAKKTREIATVESTKPKDGWLKIDKTFEVTPGDLQMDSVALCVEAPPKGVDILIDDVQMSKTTQGMR